MTGKNSPRGLSGDIGLGDRRLGAARRRGAPLAALGAFGGL